MRRPVVSADVAEDAAAPAAQASRKDLLAAQALGEQLRQAVRLAISGAKLDG